jgi:hypothetical protein
LHPADIPIPPDDTGDAYGDGSSDRAISISPISLMKDDVFIVCQQLPLSNLDYTGRLTIKTMESKLVKIICVCSSYALAEREVKARANSFEMLNGFGQELFSITAGTERMIYKNGAVGLANFMARFYIAGPPELLPADPLTLSLVPQPAVSHRNLCRLILIRATRERRDELMKKQKPSHVLPLCARISMTPGRT